MFEASNATERVVLDFFMALGSGDFTKTRTKMHPDIIWRVMGRGIPGEGVHHGADAIFKFIGPIRGLFAPGSPQIQVTSVTTQGQRLVMESHGGGQLKDGREYDNYYVMVVEVKDGLVAELREYMDTHYVHELLGEVC